MRPTTLPLTAAGLLATAAAGGDENAPDTSKVEYEYYYIPVSQS